MYRLCILVLLHTLTLVSCSPREWALWGSVPCSKELLSQESVAVKKAALSANSVPKLEHMKHWQSSWHFPFFLRQFVFVDCYILDEFLSCTDAEGFVGALEVTSGLPHQCWQQKWRPPASLLLTSLCLSIPPLFNAPVVCQRWCMFVTWFLSPSSGPVFHPAR